MELFATCTIRLNEARTTYKSYLNVFVIMSSIDMLDNVPDMLYNVLDMLDNVPDMLDNVPDNV